jgi:hypothetical protein
MSREIMKALIYSALQGASALRAAIPAALYAGERAYHLKISHVLTGDRENQVA